MSSEVNNGSFLPNNLQYTNIFDRSTLSAEEDQQVASQIDDLSVLRDALRVARVNGLVDGEQVSPLTRFPAPSNFPPELIDSDGTTSLAEVSDWLINRGSSPYLSSGVLAGVQVGGSSTAIGEQIEVLENSISQLSSTRGQGAGAGVTVVDGTFYVDGKVVALGDLYVATRLNRAHNAQSVIAQITEDIEARQKLIEAAQDLNFVLKFFQPDGDGENWFIEKSATISYGSIDNEKVSVAKAINEVQSVHGLHKNPLTLFSNVDEKEHKFRAAGWDQANNVGVTGAEPHGTRWVGGYWEYGTTNAKPDGVSGGGYGHWATAADLTDLGFTVTEHRGDGGQIGDQWTPPSGESISATTVNGGVPHLYTFYGPDIGEPQRFGNNKYAQWLNATNNSVQQINSQQERDNLTIDDQRQTFGDQLSAIGQSDDREQDSNRTIAENI